MLYKRKDPNDGFQPFSKLLTLWEQGTDNVFKVHFDMYSLLSDALQSINQYSHCGFSDPNLLAFGDCGATGAVSNNAIGSDGTSYL